MIIGIHKAKYIPNLFSIKTPIRKNKANAMLYLTRSTLFVSH